MSTFTITLPDGFVADPTVKYPKRSALAKTITEMANGEYTLVTGKYTDANKFYGTQDAVFVVHNSSLADIQSAQSDFVVAQRDKDTALGERHAWNGNETSVFVSGIYFVDRNRLADSVVSVVLWDNDAEQVSTKVLTVNYDYDNLRTTALANIVSGTESARESVVHRQKRDETIAFLKAQERPTTDALITRLQDWLDKRETTATVERDGGGVRRGDELATYKALAVDTIVARLVTLTLQYVALTTLETEVFSGRDEEPRMLTLDEAVAKAVMYFADDTYMDDPSTGFFREAVKEFRSRLHRWW